LGLQWAVLQMRQVFTDYHLGLSSRDVTLDEIRFFYMPMIEGLCKLQKERLAGKPLR
jgi:hypothetical protein